MLYGIFRNQNKNANSHPDIGLFKIAIEEEWNKIIMKLCQYDNWKKKKKRWPY